jgi:hypothetical protein
MIYRLAENILVPGKINEYYAISTKEMNPLYSKLGINQVGSFRSYTGNMNEVYALWAYEDLAALQKVQAACRNDKDYQAASAKMTAFVISQHATLLEPNPWSPMK